MVILLSVKEVLAVTGLSSRAYIWRLIKEGRFPVSVQISGDRKHQYFRQDSVLAWKAKYLDWKRDTAKRALALGRKGTAPGLDGDGDGVSAPDIAARLAQLETRVDALENPADPARGLAVLADRIDADTPGKVPAHEVEKAEAQAVK